MSEILEALYRRRAVKAFEPVEIPKILREQILDAARHAPSSFNSQPYRFFWVESSPRKATAAKLCMGQMPAATASALVVAVADIGSLAATSRAQLEWMRRSGFSHAKIRDYELTAKIGRILFMPGPFGIFGAVKWVIFRLLNLWKTIGMPPVFRQDLLKWAVKSTSLACENLMIAAEALGLNTCPMEGFDGRRLSRFLGLSNRYHEIVMVIAIGKKSPAYSGTASVAATSRCHGNRPMIVDTKIVSAKIVGTESVGAKSIAQKIILPKKDIPQDILRDSVLAHVAAAYFSVGKRLERKTQCSATRAFILSTLRGGAALNQNQIATLLGIDRTVVHRAIKSMVQEGLVSERKAKSGRAIHVTLTPKGYKYRKRLINVRIAADDKLRKELTPEERTTLLRLLKLIAELEF